MVSLAFTLAGIALAARGFGAEPIGSFQPVVVTNYVVVTNLVVVTNYVMTPNTVVSTNGLIAGRTNSLLPDLSWVPPADSFDWVQLNTGE
jgi:hypothetical protein